MARPFALAGLLRLRHLQQDQAAGELAAANAANQAHTVRRAHARAALDVLPSTVTGADTLNAVAAARASSRSMLAEMDALGRDYLRAAGEAKAAFDASRAESVSLEKLEGRHDVVVAAEVLHLEQNILDEIASTAWHRGRKGGPQ